MNTSELSKIYSYTSLAQKKESIFIPQQNNTVISLHTMPRGPETGVVVHRIFERIFSYGEPPQEVVSEEALTGSLLAWEQPLQEMVQKVLDLPLIKELDRARVRTEVEFLYTKEPHFIKGFIDLLFFREGALYFLDWKTNWLGGDDGAYTEEALSHTMDQNDYWLQAALYSEAIKRSFPEIPFGGAYYLFLRGIHATSHGLFSVGKVLE